MPVNDDIQDRSIRHLLYLTRLSSREANQVIRFIDRQIIPDLESRLARRMARINARGFDLGPATTERLNDMLAEFRQINRDNFRDMRRRVEERMDAIAQQEVKWQAGVINETLNVDIDWVMPSTRQLHVAVTQRPFDGMPLSDWYDGLGRSTQRNLDRAIRQGIIEGDTIDQMVRRVRGTRAAGFTDGIMQTTRRQAETITRSAVIHTSAQARETLYKANDDLISEVQWVATLDDRTCVVCGSLDGQTFKIDRGPRPARHPNCRCTTTPVLKSAKALGLDLPDLPPATRASMDGQVPETLTYNAWLRRQVNAGRMDIVEEALGKSRAKAFAAGGLTVDKFVAGGKTMTLAQLRKKERSVFNRLNL